MGEADLIQALTEHGFSLNESRAYTALLQSGPSTGYEVGQKAQIPRSAVYGALRRLVAAGAARSIAGSPERFVAEHVSGTYSERLVDAAGSRWRVVLGAEAADELERVFREATEAVGTPGEPPAQSDAEPAVVR